MTSKKLNCIGGFLKRWISGVLYAGYNKNMVLCFYIRKGTMIREVPHSWEFIQDNRNGITGAWLEIKEYLCRNYSMCYDLKSDTLIQSGFFDLLEMA